MTVKQLASLAGISVRTLHYYDEIGLLKPSEVTSKGYRVYDDAAAEKLMQILFFRELEFPLKEIQKILDSPSFDQRQALGRHRELLVLKRDRMDRLIRLADQRLKGESDMDLKAFDNEEYRQTQEKYREEARRRWGKTDAWRQSEAKRPARDAGWEKIQQEGEEIFREFAASRAYGPDSAQAARAVKKWQAFISSHYYTCDNELLQSLGEMYVHDERFTRFFDQRYGEGMAAFVCQAIQQACKK